jgi:CRISPR/Cas system-associated exonuclease Cas4 (RecB family)
MTESLTLAQQHLYTFRACPRRFYLRFLAKVPWPEPPLNSDLETAYERGRRFHRWIERHFLELPIQNEGPNDKVVRLWWSTFKQQGPTLPNGQRYIEFSLTVPIGGHFLTGRYDLLIFGRHSDGKPSAFIFDWKTGEPRSLERLRQAWQTRVYLAVLAEGNTRVIESASAALDPDQLSFTYWYVEEPQKTRVIGYSTAMHQQNWADLVSLVEEIDRQWIENKWPLTDDWTECRKCAYRAHCGRQAAGQGLVALADEEESDLVDDWLEPQWN